MRLYLDQLKKLIIHKIANNFSLEFIALIASDALREAPIITRDEEGEKCFEFSDENKLLISLLIDTSRLYLNHSYTGKENPQ